MKETVSLVEMRKKDFQSEMTASFDGRSLQ